MDKKIGVGLVLLTLVFAATGYVAATAYIFFREFGLSAQIDFLWLARNYLSLSEHQPSDFRRINLIIGGFALGGLLLSAVLSGAALTKFGRTHFQTRSELKKNGFHGKVGTGYVLGKTGSPRSRAKFLASVVFPHCLVVAPTGRGKTSGFVIPNLLAFVGSAVVLDVKGENFEKTARYRAARGDKIYRFAPTDWHDRRSHRYNPLLRIYELEDTDRQQMELQLLATLFLQADSDRVQGLLKGGIDIFVAAGLLAFERKRPTLGEIYRITASGGNKQKEFMMRRDEVQNRAAKLIFERMASTNNDTLTSYVSLLMTSGLDQWSNPAIDNATKVSDFDFRTIRKKPFTVYLVVSINMVKPLAPLIRLFFSDLISSLQDKEPGKDEPWPVMILLDEFNRLGKMPIVVESIETLRSYKGHLAIITQTIPALDEIYGENTRLALQGNAGVKLYLTPSDPKTTEELSKAVGKTTKRVVTRSRSIGRNPFEGRSTSERTEEAPLLTEDEAKRLSLDDIIIVVDAQMPIRAKRIKYFKDSFFKKRFAAQAGELPFPAQVLKPVDMPPPADPVAEEPVAAKTEQAAKEVSIAEASAQPHREKLRTPKRKRSKTINEAARDLEDRQRQLDLSGQDRLSRPVEGEPTAAEVERLLKANAELAALEASLSDEQGGIRITA